MHLTKGRTQLVPDLIVIHALLLQVREQLCQTALANRRIVAEHGIYALSELALLVLLQHLLGVLVDRAVRQVTEHIQRCTVEPAPISTPSYWVLLRCTYLRVHKRTSPSRYK